jgi:hypothetical protein
VDAGLGSRGSRKGGFTYSAETCDSPVAWNHTLETLRSALFGGRSWSLGNEWELNVKFRLRQCGALEGKERDKVDA